MCYLMLSPIILQNNSMSLVIKPISAIFTKDLDLFGKMDPYIVCTIGQERKRTKTHQGGGKKPNWSDTLVFGSQGQLMKVQAYDDDYGKDDFIGQASVNLTPLFQNPNRTENQYIDLLKNGKSAGRVLISMEYQGQSMGSGWGQNNGWGASQNSNWGPPPNSGWGQPQSGWGQPQSGWGQPQNGWGQPQNSNWGPPPNSGWGQPQNSGWGQPQSGWGQPQSGWGQPQSGWGNQPSGPVTFIIRPIEANLLKDLDTFSKMDPFVAISIDGNKQRTQAHQGGGKHPKFSGALSFTTTGTLMQVAVFDEDVMSNDLCGEGTYNLSNAVRNMGMKNNEWIDLRKNGKPAGRVLISIQAQAGNQGYQGGFGSNGW